MRSFFEQMPPWDRNDGSLHLYALPDDAVRERLDEAAALIDGVPHLPLVPDAWRHFTVRRLAQFDDLKHAELSRLAEAVTAELEDVAAFDLNVGAPQVQELAVECVAEASRGWEALIGAAGRAAERFGGEVFDPPHAPHLALAYATGDVEDAEVHRRLESAQAIGTVHIGQVHLVSVTVRPELGWFDWVELANWSL